MTEPKKKRRRRVIIPTPQDDYTISQFCASVQISKQHYINLRKRGLGPREIRDGRMVRISAEARADWRREMERRSASSDRVARAVEMNP